MRSFIETEIKAKSNIKIIYFMEISIQILKILCVL